MTISKCKFMCTHKNTHESAIFEKKKNSNLVGKRKLLYKNSVYSETIFLPEMQTPIP